jgi:sugar phosphate isomerase/epimerase
MKIGMVTDSLGRLSFADMLSTARKLGVEAVEIPLGNWSGAPHAKLDELLASAEARSRFMAAIRDAGLELCALNCSGNQLAPGDYGKRHDAVVRKTFELAGMLGISRVVMMSGCPGGPGDANPNWITTAWPPEVTKALNWQWSDVVIPYWKDLVAFAKGKGIKQICLELHGGQVVYNAATLLRLREAAGDMIGANFDPSHIMWMGGDPLAAVRALPGAIYHVHAKDTRIVAPNAGPNTVLETRTSDRWRERAWNYVTLGYGHGESWWREFVLELRAADYDDVLSIEHEDVLMSPVDGVRKSVELLERVMTRD